METGAIQPSHQQLIILQLIRWPNVLLTLLTQLVILYWYLPQSDAIFGLELWQEIVLMIATALLTASGNVINDIHDMPTDIINKPAKVIVGKKITEKNANILYIALTVIAVASGFVLANSIEKPALASIFIAVAFLLYTYATTIKRMLVVGNLVISFLVAAVVLITAIFSLFPAITPLNRAAQLDALLYLSAFAVFAFCVNLLREWIKDLQDVKGDHATGRSSLPIILGKQRAGRAMGVYTMVLVIIIGYIAAAWLNQDTLSLYATLFLILAPLIFIGLRLFSATTLREYRLLSLLCKLVLFVGVMGVGCIKYTG